MTAVTTIPRREKSVAAAGRELGLGPDEARHRVRVALKVIGQLLPAG